MEQDTAVLDATVQDTAAPEGAEVFVPPAPRRNAGWLKGVGIVATGLVAGAIGVATIQGSHGTSSAAATTPGGQGFGGPGGQGQGGPPGGGFRGRGGFGTPVQGTISAISPTSITVGTTTASITSATVVVKDGARSTVSALAKGDQVVLIASTTGSSTVARQVLSGSGSQNGFGGPPGQPQQGQLPPTGAGSATT